MVDVRELTWRESESKIRGAIRIDPMEFHKEVPGLPTGKELVFYCDRAGEATSMKIALWAFDNGQTAWVCSSGDGTAGTQRATPSSPRSSRRVAMAASV